MRLYDIIVVVDGKGEKIVKKNLALRSHFRLRECFSYVTECRIMRVDGDECFIVSEYSIEIFLASLVKST